MYTSIKNIHKVIDPLFLDELTRRVDEILGDDFSRVERVDRVDGRESDFSRVEGESCRDEISGALPQTPKNSSLRSFAPLRLCVKKHRKNSTRFYTSTRLNNSVCSVSSVVKNITQSHPLNSSFLRHRASPRGFFGWIMVTLYPTESKIPCIRLCVNSRQKVIITKKARFWPRLFNGGGTRIRTLEGYANRFTVCPV